MKTGFQLNKPVQLIQPYSNVDMLYGPYNSVQEALEAVPYEIRKQGLTVGVINEKGVVEEYWWNTSNVADEGLFKKNEQLALSIYRIGDYTIHTEEGELIALRFGVDGRANIQKGLLYQVVGQSEVLQQEFTSIGKGENTIIATQPSIAGVYKYRIKVLDSSGQFAETTDEVNYIEYEVRYGGISVSYNLTNLNSIQIKNVESVANQYFTATINVRDTSFAVQHVYISDGDSVNIDLVPHKSVSEETPGDYLGYKYYILPDTETLMPLNGKFCYIVIAFTEDEEPRTKQQELFTLLDRASLEFIPQSVEKNYYLNFPDYYTFQFKSGVANVSVYVSKGQDSDFTFDPVTVTSYNNYALRVIPNTITDSGTLVLNCAYTVGGTPLTKTFTQPIGRINDLPEREFYNPPSGSVVSRDTLVEATSTDFVDGARYYKIENDFVSSPVDTCAFIVDIECKINQINDKSLKYIRIMQGNVEIGYITEDIINCNGSTTDTPLNQWMQIGLGFNLEESITRGSDTSTAKYQAIYIDGMIVKNIKLGDGGANPIQYDSTKQITIEMSNGIQVSKAFVYYSNNSAVNTINPKADVYSIIYTNYLAHNPDFEEPSDLPLLKLRRITDETTRHKYFRMIQQYNKHIKHLTKFGTIGLEKAKDMGGYDTRYYTDDEIDHDDATLFRQSVDIKKPAQKEFAVLCEARWMDGESLNSCIVEVHTQGTSTLVYAVPNFKFTFWKLVVDEQTGDEMLQPFYPQFIQKGDGSYYQEYIYTAKADFMDSSHLNNTPTCNFYNTLVQNMHNSQSINFDASPSAEMGNLDAIMGFPIVLEISDNAESMDDIFTNIGSFMLNIDKTGQSLGFETGTQSCLSFEGTSNDNEHGSAGRFIIPETITLPYGDGKQSITIDHLKEYADDEEIESDYNIAKNVIKNQSNVASLTGLPYVQWCNFWSQGLEYRYPDSDIYKEENDKVSKILSLDHFKKIYHMWTWVNKSDTLGKDDYIAQFKQHFDVDYCVLYFIQLMIFGQTDNLGKNAMFDCWDGAHWYPRPYDLDSQAGLDNNGNDNVAPFVEIKPEFSLNWNPNYTPEQRAENYLLEESLIPYGTQTYKRYHYSSNSSKLWINFYKNFKEVIESFYKQIRTTKLSQADTYTMYSPTAIINLCKSMLIDKLGVSQYNQDFSNKYLATNDQSLAYGNRWDKFKKWITQRFAFCDSYFGASDAANYNLVQAITYNVEVQSPQYITQTYQSNNIVKFVIDRAQFQSGSAAATKLTLNVNQAQVLNTTLFKYVSWQFGPAAYENLITLDVSQNQQISTIESLVGTTLNNLKTLNINNSSVSSLNVIPIQLKTLYAENVKLNSIIFPESCSVENIDLRGTTINTDVSFNRLPNLKRLDLTGCTINGSITLADLPSLEEFIIDDTKFNGNIIISNNVKITSFDFSNKTLSSIVFNGNDIDLKTLNFNNTTFIQDTINLNAISNHLENIYFNGCRGLLYLQLTEGITFNSIVTFSIYDSSIVALGSNSSKFDASHFPNISALKSVRFNTSGVITSRPAFTFEQTNVADIINLVWNGSGSRLFYMCQSLTSVQGTLNIITSLDYMFWRCAALETLPTINIDSSVVSAQYTFAGANALTYAQVSDVISRCTNVKNFTGVLFCKDLPDDTEVNITTLFNNGHVTNISYALCPSNWSQTITSVTNKIKIVGYVPSTVTHAVRAFCNLTEQVPYDIFKNADNVQNMDCTFYGSRITFYIQLGSEAVLPTIEVEGETVTLTDTIDGNFLPASVTDLSCTFESSNIQPLQNNVFNSLVNLVKCPSCFRGSHSGKFTNDFSIDNLWRQCPNLTNVAGCFANVINVYCTASLRFHNSIASSKTIDISGLFGLSTFNEGSLQININFSGIVPTLITDNYYRTGGNTTTYMGTFQNRKIYATDSADPILSKIQGTCRNLFYGARLFVKNSVTTLDMHNVTYATSMFQSCSIYNADQEQLTRKFVKVILPNSCSYFTNMFTSSYVLSELPLCWNNSTSAYETKMSPSAQYVQNMFQGCIINQASVQLPADYFQLCKSTLLNASSMFYGNRYLTELLYNRNVGLFSDCVNVQSVTNMFNGCWFLHKGIPNNFFGTTPLTKITTLQGMFADTSIFYDVDNESNRWVDSNTIAPLTNLTNVQQLFYRMRINNNSATEPYTYREQVKNSDNQNIYVISPDTFTNHTLQNIRELFYRSSTVKNIPFAFLNFEYGDNAFCDCPITRISDPFITDENNFYNVKNVTKMFGMRIGSNKTVTNLGAFVDKLKTTSQPIMANIAGNLQNTDVSEDLKADFDLAVDYGHSINTKELWS